MWEIRGNKTCSSNHQPAIVNKMTSNNHPQTSSRAVTQSWLSTLQDSDMASEGLLFVDGLPINFGMLHVSRENTHLLSGYPWLDYNRPYRVYKHDYIPIKTLLHIQEKGPATFQSTRNTEITAKEAIKNTAVHLSMCNGIGQELRNFWLRESQKVSRFN